MENEIINSLINKHLTLSTMESCSSGSLCSTLTDVSGSSEVIKGGLITYCTDLKIKFGVDKNVIDTFTVYSKETAIEMSKNVRAILGTDIGIGVTGCLGRLDPNNKGGNINKVYVDICTVNKHHTFIVTVPNTSRHNQKKIIN